MSASEYTAYDSFKQVFVHLFIADQLPFGKGGLKRFSPLKQFSYSSSSVFFRDLYLAMLWLLLCLILMKWYSTCSSTQLIAAFI